MIEIWEKNISDEIAFWDRWCATQGELWHDDYLFRLNPNNEIQEKYKKYINSESKILDCGSGMYSVLGRNYEGIQLDICCVDALADEFEKLRNKYKLPEIDLLIGCTIENLKSGINNRYFDFVHAQNCLDHSYNPVLCFKNMLHVCKPGGYVYTHHEINEGKNENYNGLHQWNFYEDDGFYVSDKNGNSICISEIFQDHKQFTEVNHGWITFIIKKGA